MAITETAAHGAVLGIGDGTTVESFFTVEGITAGPTGGGYAARIIDLFTHSSSVIIKTATVTEPTDLTFELAYDSSDTYHAQLRDAAKNLTQTNFELTFTDTGAEKIAFAAVVATFDRSADPEDWNKISVTLTPFGDFTIT
ncbi:MAG: hypothetical protein GTN64_05465 [Candidatus Latescibacteria bacterium]|nr:hypothetical protein [Candidatus Latescibacterota bacterium]NIO78058.1 hypothetical protein [Candidatus Latescibacterota bacterium]